MYVSKNWKNEYTYYDYDVSTCNKTNVQTFDKNTYKTEKKSFLKMYCARIYNTYEYLLTENVDEVLTHTHTYILYRYHVLTVRGKMTKSLRLNNLSKFCGFTNRFSSVV